MPRLLVIDDRDQTVEMVHRRLPQLETVTRCDRSAPCQVCEERERGCPLRCAHDWGEAAEALARSPALPDLVVLDLHFARPEERLLPEDKSDLPSEARARAAAIDALRRRQGLLILERLRRTYPTLPVVMTPPSRPSGRGPGDCGLRTRGAAAPLPRRRAALDRLVRSRPRHLSSKSRIPARESRLQKMR